jgi:hypothetical protein
MQGWNIGEKNREYCREILRLWVDNAMSVQLLNRGVSSGNLMSPNRKRVTDLLFDAVALESLKRHEGEK